MHSAYKDVPVNGSYQLYSGPLSLKDADGEVTGHGSISLNLQGKPQIRYDLAYTSPPRVDASKAELTIPAIDSFSPAEVLILNDSFKLPSGAATASGIFNGAGLTLRELKPNGKQESVGRIQFHLINFTDYIGTFLSRPHEGEERRWQGRVTFPFGKWSITLDQFPDIEQRLKEARVCSQLIQMTAAAR